MKKLVLVYSNNMMTFLCKPNTGKRAVHCQLEDRLHRTGTAEEDGRKAGKRTTKSQRVVKTFLFSEGFLFFSVVMGAECCQLRTLSIQTGTILGCATVIAFSVSLSPNRYFSHYYFSHSRSQQQLAHYKRAHISRATF